MNLHLSHYLAAAALSLFGSATMAQSDVQASAPWARATVQGQQAGGAFISLRSEQGDVLLGASSPAAASMEIHEMRLENDVMRMRQIPSLQLPAGQVIELKPGGHHLMFQGLHQPLQSGTEVEVTLLFEKAGKRALRFPVRPLTSGAPQGGHHHSAPSPHHGH